MTLQPVQTQQPSAPADADERAAALQVDRSVLVEAPAGSGKTGLLVQRLLRLLCRVDRPEAVLALTFTNKATAEMRERVLKALDLTAKDPATLDDFDRATREFAATLLEHDRAHGWNLRQNSHRLNIRTIDSLCGEIVRALPVTSGAIGQTAPVDDPRRLYLRAARAVIRRLGDDDAVLNDALRTVLLRRDADMHNVEDLLADMLARREQWARLIPLSPEELTDDFLDRVVKPKLDKTLEQIVCDALGHLREKFQEEDLAELTMLAAQLASAEGYKGELNPIARCAGLPYPPGAAAADAEHWALLAKLLLNASSPYAWRRSWNVNHLGFAITPTERARLGALTKALSHRDDLHAALCDLRNLPPAAMPDEDWRVTKALFHLLHTALLELRSIFYTESVCDFTELSLVARAALRNGASRSLELQHLLVDEMQDTSTAQYELLEDLTRDWDGSRRTVFLVGDPKQSIYLFRQARVENFLASMAKGALGGVPLQVLRLSTNFRSVAPLVADFNQLFSPVFASPSSGGIPYGQAVAARQNEPGGLVWQVEPLWGDYGSPERRDRAKRVRREQAQHMVRTIHELRRTAPPDSPPRIAVLVRGREHAAPLVRLLKSEEVRQSGAIPFRGVDLEALDERPEVLDALALTRALLHPADRVAWLAVLRAPWCGASLPDLHHLAAGEETAARYTAPRQLFRQRLDGLPAAAQGRVRRTLDVLDGAVASLGRMPLSELVERTGRALGVDLFRTEAERTNVRRFLELLEDSEARLERVDAELLQERLSHLYAEPDTTPGAVEIMTIHKAKGLEWDVVFVPDTQRETGSNGPRLLDWLELPGASNGAAEVMLAPIPPRGIKTAELGCYVQNARKRQEVAEAARLLYVVVTRARQAIYLYAAPDLKKETREVSRRAGTLLAAAWPGAGGLVEQEALRKQVPPETRIALEAGASVEGDAAPRILTDLRRVPDGLDLSELQQPAAFPWAAATTPQPPFQMEVVSRPEGALASRTLGNTVHAFFDLLATHIAAHPEKSPEHLLTEVAQWERRVRVVVRAAGVPAPQIDSVSANVLDFLRKTISSAEGLWLLQPHPQARSEEAIAVGGSDTTLRLDRSFLAGSTPGSTGDDTLWIVDYKTSAPGDTPLRDFLAAERHLYEPQLRNYARLRTNRPGTPTRIMLGLFYPAVSTLDSWLREP